MGAPSEYYKCNGDVKVYVDEDGSEMFDIPSDYRQISSDDEFGISCPNCNDEELLFYHNGEFICVNCESTFTEKELEDYSGGKILII